jgi:hypothetical protein
METEENDMSFQLPKASDKVHTEQRDIPDEGLHIVTFKGWTEPALSIYTNERTGEIPMTTRFLFDIVSDIEGATYEFPFEIATKYLNIPEGSLGRKSNMRMYVEAIMGRALEDGEAPPDLETLIGRECIIDIVHNIKEYDDGAVTFANIKSITPKRQAKSTKKRPAVEPENDPFPQEPGF